MIDNEIISDLSNNAKKKIHKDINVFLTSLSNKENFASCHARHLRYFSEGKNLPFTKDEFDRCFSSKDFWKLAFDCGSWLEFRWYQKSDVTKLHTANFCKRDKMCPACAIRRAYKQQLKFINILDSDSDLKDLDWYYIVLPIKHNKSENYETVFNRLNDLKIKINMGIRDGKRGKGKGFFSNFSGGMSSIETTHSKNGWNVHLNLIINAPKGTKTPLKSIKNSRGQISHQNEDLRQFMLKHADSQMHNIQKLDFDKEENIREALVEVLKYSLKFSGLTNQQLLEVYVKTYKKRLFGTFGNLRGVGIEDVSLEGDVLLDTEFVELIFTRAYSDYTLYKKELKQIVDVEKRTTDFNDVLKHLHLY